jgi:CheY-like chemotaxis protein
MANPIREARLKEQYSGLYPGVEPGIWMPADAATRMSVRRGDRTEMAEHFEFRPAPGPGDPSVLVLDADEMDRLVLRAVLTGIEARVNVIQTGDPETALRLLGQARYDLILLGDSLRQFAVEEVLDLLRSASPDTPVLRHTAYLTQCRPGDLRRAVDEALTRIAA